MPSCRSGATLDSLKNLRDHLAAILAQRDEQVHLGSLRFTRAVVNGKAAPALYFRDGHPLQDLRAELRTEEGMALVAMRAEPYKLDTVYYRGERYCFNNLRLHCMRAELPLDTRIQVVCHPMHARRPRAGPGGT